MLIKILKSLFFKFLIILFSFIYLFKCLISKKQKISFGFCVAEFFHQDLGGFGGFGMTVKNVTDFLEYRKV